ncbi:MAG: dimethyl sulfoxide reductase anchor subunit [Elusimicrobia bacterium]|nr:dimethyl sulfoxide reductase anchor subunit [Elusimicrobiota bacterium]
MTPQKQKQSLETSSLLQDLLKQQNDLTAVERFSKSKEAGALPDQAKYYQDLIPLSTPDKGEQYGFEVDLDACTGCKACVSACHNLNGLDEKETWRSVGHLTGGSEKNPKIFTVTTACHHCLDPACLSGCPTQAYFKDPKTGIVKHLDDQCFGCKYCTLTCPYEVPQYNPSLGIVRKCDMCQDRLNLGEAPSCVQACPNQAIEIKIVKQKEVMENAESKSFLPLAPDPQKTYPTTNYKTKSPFPKNLLPQDYYSIKKSHSHLPLVFMLVLTQLSIGVFTIKWISNFLLQNSLSEKYSLLFTALTFFLGQLAMAASLFHLGRPYYAFRAVIGLRTSWLSREIVAMAIFSFLTFSYAFCFCLNQWTSFFIPKSVFNHLETLTVICGLAALGTSVMVYRATKRDSWNTSLTIWKFYLSAFVTGSSFFLLLLDFFSFYNSEIFFNLMQTRKFLLLAILSGILLKLSIESSILSHLKNRHLNPLKRSALLLIGELKNVFKARICCGLVGGIGIPGILFLMEDSIRIFILLLGSVSFVLILAGELLERYLFFTSEGSDKMPGGFS